MSPLARPQPHSLPAVTIGICAPFARQLVHPLHLSRRRAILDSLRRCISGSMAWDDLTEEDRQEMARLLRQAIEGER